MKPAIFTALFSAAVAYFVWTVRRLAKFMLVGKPDTGAANRFADIPKRLAMVLIYFFGQKKVAEEGPQHRTSKHHLFIFWGFLVITIGTADLVIARLVPPLALAAWLPGSLYRPLTVVIDVFNLIVLAMVTWAVIRRTVVRPRLIPWNLDAGLILGAIGSLICRTSVLSRWL